MPSAPVRADAQPGPSNAEKAAAYVQVALPLPLPDPLTYRVPAGCSPVPQPGSRVQVPLGRRRVVGVVVDVVQHPGDVEEASVRELHSVVDPEPVLDSELLEFCRWAARYYFASWGEVLACAVPGFTGPGPQVPRRLILTARGRAHPEELQAACGRSRRRRELVDDLLGSKDGILRGQLPRDVQRIAAPLLDAQLVKWCEVAMEPAPAPAPATASGAPLQLNVEQEAAVAAVQAALRGRTYRPLLLRGVTGSGKTEVYLRAAEETLAQGRGVVYLVPEIGLTPLLSRQFVQRFGNRVAVLHSGLSRGERQRQWQRVRSGEATVVLGARSALFAPMVRPGLFVVDEEQENSFKQDERPRYHARDLALVRARECGAVVLLGSATPSMESFHHARTGKYQLLELTRRVEDRPMARTEVVDMREEFRSRGVADPLSRRLESLLRAGLERGEQSLLLLNRRGYATFVLCRECGEAVSCPQCSVTLVLHRSEARLRCHHCGYWRRQPETCPACGGGHLHWGGEGTQRMEERLRARLEGVRMVRLDRDAVRRRGEAERILTGFDRGEWDVLLGTQMVAKGHDFSRVTLVGVLAAESTLCMPDFRAAERTFHLITQVVGRSGRGRTPGQAVIQTFQPQHYAIRYACEQDYLKFFEHEIRFRKLLQYPPFTVLANLIIARRQEGDARSQAQALAGELGVLGKEHVRVVGPAAAPLARLRGLFRFQILLKARARGRLLEVLRGALDAHRRQGHSERHVMVDMDPMSLL